MKVLGRAAGSANASLTDGSVRAAWLRAGIVGVVALALVLTIQIGSPRAAGEPFNPTVTFETSTTQATAHPDARISIASNSDEKLKAVTIDLPDGFWGSLAAADKCVYATAAAGNCTDDSQVGSITASAQVDQSDVVLEGEVYLTAPHPDFASIDPAWLSVKINPDVGGVTSFDPIVTPARIVARYLTITPPSGATLFGQPAGIRTQIGNIAGHPEFDVPTEVTDSNNRTIEFTLQKVSVDLKSDQNPTPPLQPLLTNPSSCAAGKNFVASFVGHGGTEPAATSIPYQSTGCANTKLRPTSNLALSSPVAGTLTGISGTIEFPEGSSSIEETKLRLPPSLSVNFPGVVTAAMCPSGSYQTSPAGAVQWFEPALCPPGDVAIMGTAEIETPLLSEPLEADIYSVITGSIPQFVIYADPTTGPNNPAGISIPIIVRNSANAAAMCPSGYTVCPSNTDVFSSTIVKLPDTPVSKVTIDLAKPDGWRAGGYSTKLLTVLQSFDPECRPNGTFTAEFKGHSGITAASANVQQISGCDWDPAAEITLGTSFADVNPTDTTPSIPFTPSPTDCVFGSADVYETGCSSPATPSSALPFGLNVFSLSEDGFTPGDYRVLTVQNPPSLPESDTIAPVVSLDSTPGSTTDDTTPTVDFSATGSPTEFQCALNGGAFLPCGTGASGSYTIADPLIPGDTEYSISVRAQDAAGNISSPATVNFQVDVPFAPTFDVTPSTTTARAHPTLDVEITSNSHEDLKNLELSMPDGFFGGLSSVPELCPVATAQAGACTSTSKIGTVNAEAVVDKSTVRLPGTVHLTDPIQAGDPAGLFITVPAKLQDVDMGNISVPVRLTVRGNVKGLDSFATDLPNSVGPTALDAVTEFDLKRISLKLENNPAAPQPLLTNPSQCGPSAFTAKLDGDATGTISHTVPFQATGCGNLGFGPQLSISLVDGTTGQAPGPSTPSKPVSANLSAKLTSNPGDAGLKDVSILFPKPVTINVLQLPLSCRIAAYNAGGAEACDPSSVIGSVEATSPLLRQPLTGKVYLLQPGDSSTTLPRILMALRGPINTDIIGVNRFENSIQVRSVFTDLPDVPLSSFTMNVSKLISTRNEACATPQNEWSAFGTLGAHNGSSAGVVNPLSFTCAASGTAKFKNRGKKTTLTLKINPPSGTTLKSVSVKFPRGLKTIKKGLKKKASYKGGSRKLQAKCAKASANRLTANFCKKKVASYTATFKAGSLTATKKVKKPKFTVTTVDSMNRKSTFTVQAK